MHISFRKVDLATLSVVAALAFGSGVAWAAPQSLALVATHGPVELKCLDGACGAEFSTFCLQMDRRSPPRGTPYRLADGGAVRLIGTTKDGREVALDARRFLRFESLRTHLALAISVPRQQVDRLGLTRLAVVVGDNVTLLPGDAAEGDLAVLEQSLRPLGSLLVDGNDKRMAAARITSRMINALPATGRGGGDALWRRALDDVKQGQVPAMGAVTMARKAFDFCRFAESRSAAGGLRRCLQSEHDWFLDYLNSTYWKAVRTGS